MPKRDFLAIPDFSRTELESLFDLAVQMKRGGYADRPLDREDPGHDLRQDLHPDPGVVRGGRRTSSAATRCSSPRATSSWAGASRSATPPGCSRGYVDGIMIRTYAHAEVEELARFATVPVINGLTDLLHPCQVLADLLTMREQLGGFDGKVVAWVGDGNNMANSWLNAAGLLGFELRLACPEGYEPDRAIFERSGGADQGEHHRAPRRGGGRGARGHHRRLGLDGAGGRVRGAPRGLQGLRRGRGADGAGRPGRDLPPLPARPPRRGGDARRCSEGPASPGVGRGREPAARAEGTDGHAHGIPQHDDRDSPAHPALRRPRGARREDGALRRLGNAGAVPRRDPGRAPGGARGGGDLRRLPHGRVRGHRPGPERLRQPDHLQRRRGAGAGAGAVLRVAQRGGHLRGRLHRVPLRGQGDAGGQRRQHRQGLGAHRGRRSRAPTSGSGTSRTRSACWRCRGRGPRRCCSRSPRRPSATSATITLPRDGGRGRLLHLPHRLHRRGRLRALLPQPATSGRSGTP